MTTQSLLTRIPENTSFLQGNKYTFEFPTLPFLKYFCQSVNLPGVQTNAVSVETPFSATFRHGDKLVYDSFEVIALVDEDLRVWEESYDWLKALTFPNEFRQYYKNTNGRDTAYHDGVLTINIANPVQHKTILGYLQEYFDQQIISIPIEHSTNFVLIAFKERQFDEILNLFYKNFKIKMQEWDPEFGYIIII